MEELGSIKSFRNNCILVSIIILLVLIFNSNIEEINIFGIIKIDNVNTLKFFMLLALGNIYFLSRYYQYFIKTDKDLNSKLLIREILRNSFFKKNIYEIVRYTALDDNFDDYTTTGSNAVVQAKDIKSVKFHNGIQLETTKKSVHYFCHGAVENDKIFGGFTGIASNENFGIYLHNKDPNRLNDNIHIEIKSNKVMMLYCKVKFYFMEHYFGDYILPIILSVIAHILLMIKITYLMY